MNIDFKTLKESANDQQLQILADLKEGKSVLNVKPNQIKQLPIAFIADMGNLFQNGSLVVIVESTVGNIGTIGALSSAELMGTTNANRTIDWKKVNETLTESLTGTPYEVPKSVKEGLTRTFSKALTAIGAKVLLDKIDNKEELMAELEKCIGVDTLGVTSSKLLSMLKEGLTTKE